MAVKTLKELFIHDLEDIYYAEQELLKALDELEEQTENEEIADAFAAHRTETEDQIDRLDEVFQIIDKEPETEKCEGVEGLLKEHRTFIEEEEPEGKILDLHNLAAGQKTEHYEISAYGNMAVIADRLDLDDAGDLLHENLEEEKAALDKLSGFVDDFDFRQMETVEG